MTCTLWISNWLYFRLHHLSKWCNLKLQVCVQHEHVIKTGPERFNFSLDPCPTNAPLMLFHLWDRQGVQAKAFCVTVKCSLTSQPWKNGPLHSYVFVFWLLLFFVCLYVLFLCFCCPLKTTLLLILSYFNPIITAATLLWVDFTFSFSLHFPCR